MPTATAAPLHKRPYVVLFAGCFIALLTFGIRADFGILNAPITAFHGWDREIFALSFALQNLVWGAAMPFAGAIADRYGSAKVLASGSALFALGMALMVSASTPAAMHLTAGVMVGVGMAAASFSVILAAIGRVFPEDKRSWALGMGTAAGSLGMFVMLPIGQAFLDAYGWQTTCLLLGGAVALGIPLSTLLRGRGGADVVAAQAEQSLGEALREARGHKSYWYLVSGFFVCGFQVAFITMHFPAYVIDIGLPGTVGAMGLALIGLFNIFGSYSAGVLGGRFSKKYLLAGLYLSRSAVVTIFLLAPVSEIGTLVFASVMGVLWLSTVPLTSGLVAQMFGIRYMATLFGVVFFSHQVGSFLGVWLGGLSYDLWGTYDPVWWGGVVLGIVAALIHWPIKEAPVARLAPGGAA